MSQTLTIEGPTHQTPTRPTSSFQISALPLETFAPFFDLDDTALAARGARRYVATKKPGFPCRVSLEDAEEGEEHDAKGRAPTPAARHAAPTSGVT